MGSAGDKGPPPRRQASGSDKPKQEGKQKKRRRGSRRRRGPKKPEAVQPESAAAVLAQKSERIDLGKSAEDPLSPQEVAALKEHFRFLASHRKELRLKVNAAEDLLLNGVHEPTHRGVCQHLLGKVDRRSVLAAAERLEPAAAARLLAGIIRFAADIEYVLLFLEKIQNSSSPKEATAALSEGLQRIDFDGVSAAQMRRVLLLITELFDDRQRPEILLGMLESHSFRQAFDSSIADLPEPLARIVLPLRAAQAVILRGKPNTLDSEALRAGIRLLLTAADRTLLRHSREVRARLLHFGLLACDGPDHPLHRGLRTLLGSFPKTDRSRADLTLSLVSHLLAQESDREARVLLQSLLQDDPNQAVAQRWLEHLDRKRIDRFALLDKPAETQDALGQHRRVPAVWLHTMRPVWLQIGSAENVTTLEDLARLLTQLFLPGVAPLLATGITAEDAPYIVLPDTGPPLERALRHKGGLTLGQATQTCLDTTAILAALASSGVELPDAKLSRFSRELGGRIWLSDLTGAKRASTDAAQQAHIELARELCQQVLDRGSRYVAPRDVTLALASASHCAELARALMRSAALTQR